MSNNKKYQVFLSKFNQIKETAFAKIKEDLEDKLFWENIIFTLYYFWQNHSEMFEIPPFEAIEEQRQI